MHGSRFNHHTTNARVRRCIAWLCVPCHFCRYTEINSAKSLEDAATRPATPTAAAAAAASSIGRGRGSGGRSPSRLFAKATYRNFEDMLEKEPGAILVDFYAT